MEWRKRGFLVAAIIAGEFFLVCLGVLSPEAAGWLFLIAAGIAAGLGWPEISRGDWRALLPGGGRCSPRRLIWHAEWATHNLLNEPVATDEDVEALKAKHVGWVARVVRDMQKMGCMESYISRIRVIDTYTARGLQGRSVAHAQVREWTAERTERLRRIAGEIEGAGTGVLAAQPQVVRLDPVVRGSPKRDDEKS